MMRMGVAAPRTYPTVNDDIVLGGFKVDGVRRESFGAMRTSALSCSFSLS
jgi:hypothetical protein